MSENILMHNSEWVSAYGARGIIKPLRTAVLLLHHELYHDCLFVQANHTHTDRQFNQHMHLCWTQVVSGQIKSKWCMLVLLLPTSHLWNNTHDSWEGGGKWEGGRSLLFSIIQRTFLSPSNSVRSYPEQKNAQNITPQYQKLGKFVPQQVRLQIIWGMWKVCGEAHLIKAKHETSITLWIKRWNTWSQSIEGEWKLASERPEKLKKLHVINTCFKNIAEKWHTSGIA